MKTVHKALVGGGVVVGLWALVRVQQASAAGIPTATALQRPFTSVDQIKLEMVHQAQQIVTNIVKAAAATAPSA
jgi:hypothetical protein